MTESAPSAAPAHESSSDHGQALHKKLQEIRQGDLITLGAISIVGVGHGAALDLASTTNSASPDDSTTEEQLWSVTIENESGLYVVLSQDCDIVRDPSIEPCLVVASVRYVDTEEWNELISGPSSPRQFPIQDPRSGPSTLLKPHAVADIRYVTSVDKTALLHPRVDFWHPLSATSRDQFRDWVGRRYSRAPHPDNWEQYVLPAVRKRVKNGLKQYGKWAEVEEEKKKSNGKVKSLPLPSPEDRLLGAITSWYVYGNDKRVNFVAVVSERSLKKSRFWGSQALDEEAYKKAVRELGVQMRAELSSNAYALSFQARTAHMINLADLTEWSPWIVR